MTTRTCPGSRSQLCHSSHAGGWDFKISISQLNTISPYAFLTTTTQLNVCERIIDTDVYTVVLLLSTTLGTFTLDGANSYIQFIQVSG